MQSWRKRWKAQEELETLLIEECAASKSFEWLVGGNGQPPVLFVTSGIPSSSSLHLSILSLFGVYGCNGSSSSSLGLSHIPTTIYIHIRHKKTLCVWESWATHTFAYLFLSLYVLAFNILLWVLSNVVVFFFQFHLLDSLHFVRTSLFLCLHVRTFVNAHSILAIKNK